MSPQRVVVITGGASGIGLACARRFASSGASLALIDRDSAALDTARVELEQAGAKVLVLASDVADAEAVERDGRAIHSVFGQVDVLVTCAGWSPGGNAVTTSLDDWRRAFAINVEGTWLWSRAVLPGMQARRKGAIIMIASQLALAGARNNSAYVASKGAVISLARTMALDFVGDGIRVNVVAPGAIETPLLVRAYNRTPDPAAARARSAARHAMGRPGQPDEVAAAIEFLAGDGASFITGTVLPVEGGWLVN